MKSSAVRALSRTCFLAFALLASQAAISGADQDLLAAATKGELPKLERAIKKKANLDARGEKKATALMLAAENGHLDVVRALLAAGAKADATREGGVAAIHAACATGQLEIVKELLSAGVSIGTPTETGLTPILVAAMRGKVEVMRFLADSGADKGAVDARGLNLLDFALYSRKWPAIQYVLDAGGTLSEGGKNTAMFKLIASSTDQLSGEPAADAKLIRGIIAAGAKLEGTNGDGMTPLLEAIKMGHVDAVEALIDGKANLAAVTEDGDGVLAVAARRDTMENLQMLLALSSNSGGSVKQMFKPALRSDVSPATARRLTISRRLIAAGAAVNATSKTGYTPLHRAVQLGDAELVDVLIAAGANVNAVNDFNTTALMIATTWGFEAPLKSLLAAGADKSIANKNGATAVSIARENKNATIIGLLEGTAK